MAKKYFRRKVKSGKAKALAKPRSEAEKKKVEAGLRKQYPQMYTDKWAKGLSKGGFRTLRTKGIERALRKSLTEREIRSLRGLK